MRIERAQWLHRHDEFSEAELCELSGLSATELRDLVDYGVLAPVDPGARTWTFSADRLVVARSAFRLRKDFDLDLEGLTLLVSLLERVRELEGEVRDLRARLPGGSR
ncbi:MAG: chaperone modulator CbpM [Burkholderiales bacterium]